MAKAVPFEKIVWLFLTIFNILAIITIFEFNTFIVPMIWVDAWIVIAFKAEGALKTYITVNAARKNKNRQ